MAELLAAGIFQEVGVDFVPDAVLGVWLCGHDVCLGEHGSPESQQQYHRLISEWLANGRRPIEARADLIVVELCAAYWRQAVA